MSSSIRSAMEDHSIETLRMMILIRAFETALAKRRDHGFQLLSTGEEAVAVGLCSALSEKDQLLTGGRSIGPALARGVDPGRLVAELLGKATGTNRGKGGRGHLAHPDSGFFGAHAVVGGNVSIAAGVALARKLERKGGFVAILFGDGACGAGSLHETLNMAAIWKLPLLFVCNNNQLSVSTSRADVLAPKRLSDLGTSFGLPSQTVDGMDVETVAEAAKAAAQTLREGGGPVFLECLSQRFSSHSTTAREMRDPAELARIKTDCPIRRQIARLRAAGVIDADAEEALEQQAQARVAEAFAFADASPYPHPAEVLTDVG
jgi:TPP-dependent pyruvate/acetoin dehydrogenase alpha subunit